MRCPDPAAQYVQARGGSSEINKYYCSTRPALRLSAKSGNVSYTHSCKNGGPNKEVGFRLIADVQIGRFDQRGDDKEACSWQGS